jgi:uncharacterized protein
MQISSPTDIPLVQILPMRTASVPSSSSSDISEGACSTAKDKQPEKRRSDALLLPIEVHVFEHASQYYAFDTRNFAIIKLDRVGAEVLKRAHNTALEDIINELNGQISPSIVRAHYAKFIEMVLDGTLSSEPVPRPARPEFNHLVIMLAGGCNMGCSYCFERDVPIYQNPNLLSRARADEILEWFFRHQEGTSAHLQLYGGEPLLNWPILKHVVERMETWASEKGITLTKYMITNGTLLNAERIAWLKAHGVTVQVSVDGDAETHNRFRVFKSGKPTMAAIKLNIQELSKQAADFNLRAVVTRENKSPQKIVEGLRQLGASRASFEVVATDASAAQFTDEDWEDFLAEYSKYMDNSVSPWAELPDDMKSMITKICRRQRIFYGCGAGISEVTVAPDGSIYECQRIYRRPYSNVAEDRSPTQLNSQLLTMVDDRPICKDCWARYLCGGGCMHQAHIGHGNDDPLPQYCTMKRSLVEASIVQIDRIRHSLSQVSDK